MGLAAGGDQAMTELSEFEIMLKGLILEKKQEVKADPANKKLRQELNDAYAYWFSMTASSFRKYRK